MTIKKLLRIEKFIALALILVNAVLLIVGLVTGVNVIGPVLGLVVMIALYVVLYFQGKKLKKFEEENQEKDN
jgi:uncharacterized membrane protein